MYLRNINRLFYIKDGKEVNISSEPEDSELYYFPQPVIEDKNIKVIKELSNGTRSEIPRNRSVFTESAKFTVLSAAMFFLCAIT